MILGMSVSTFTLVHVVLSLVGMVSGAVVLICMLGANRPQGWTALFLATTVATSATGFMLPSPGFGPPEVIGVISLVALAAAIIGFYGYRLSGAWRWIYVAGAMLALYLNVFVGIVQAFQKLPFLQPLAPTQSEPPFVAAQVAALVVLAVLGALAVRRFHPK